MNIKLNNIEEEIFSSLRKVVEHYGLSTQLRVAGGWVRDKLMGKEADDIDVMVDNMSGEEFGKLVSEYLGFKGPNIIQTNPEKSKHIETAILNFPLKNGESIKLDFAQARTEVYNDDSRNPEVKPATAEEDAFRRDLTINSLFYNINNGQIEDFTGRGIDDLKNKIIATPLDPLKTFTDDPLRIFRTIRFAARYNYDIDPAVLEQMSNPNLIEAIKNKISKERISEEMKKMLKGANPAKAIELLKDTGLFQHLLNDALVGTEFEGNMDPLDTDQNNPHHEMTVWDHTLKVIENYLKNVPDTDDETRIVMILSALVHDIGKLHKEIQKPSKSYPERTSYIGHEESSSKIAQYLLKSLKFENAIINKVSQIAANHMRPHDLERSQAGAKGLRKFVRQMGEASLKWTDILDLAIADAYSKKQNVDPEIVERYNVLKNNLEKAVADVTTSTNSNKSQPVVNGRDIMQALNIKSGAHMKGLIEFAKDMLDDNPKYTKEEILNEIKKISKQAINDYGLPTEEALTKYFSNDIKSSVENNIKTAGHCSKQFLSSTIDDINKSLSKERTYEALQKAISFYNENIGAEKAEALLLECYFYNLCKNKQAFEVLERKADELYKKSYFDGKICAYVYGISIFTKLFDNHKNALLKERANSYSPKTLKKVEKLIKGYYNG